MSRLAASMPWLAAAGVAAQLHPATSFLILPGAALLGMIHGTARPECYERRLDRLEGAVAIWLLCWLLSTVLALEPAHAVALSVPVLLFALLFAVLHRADDTRLHDAILLALLGLAGAQSIAILVASTTPGTPQEWIAAAASPWLLVPNDAVWMTCLWPLWWTRARGSRRRMLCAAVLLLQLAALVVLQSRLALLVLAALALHAACTWRRESLTTPAAVGRRGWMRLAVVAAVLLVAGGVVAVVWFGKGGGSLQARVQLAQAAWQLWLAHPWFGVGPHGYGFEYRQFVDGVLIDPRHTPWPHSLPLELLACTGMIGFAAFLRVVWAGVTRMGAVGLPSAWAASMLAFGIASLLEASTLRLWWWVLLALLLAQRAPSRRELRS
jgi:hypothetical protein